MGIAFCRGCCSRLCPTPRINTIAASKARGSAVLLGRDWRNGDTGLGFFFFLGLINLFTFGGSTENRLRLTIS